MNQPSIPQPAPIGDIYYLSAIMRPEPGRYLPTAAIYEAVGINARIDYIGAYYFRHASIQADSLVPTLLKPRQHWKVDKIYSLVWYEWYVMRFEPQGNIKGDRRKMPIWNYVKQTRRTIPRPPQMTREQWRKNYQAMRIIARRTIPAAASPLAYLMQPYVKRRLWPQWMRHLNPSLREADIFLVQGEAPPLVVSDPGRFATRRHIATIVIGDVTACRLLGLDCAHLAAMSAIENTVESFSHDVL